MQVGGRARDRLPERRLRSPHGRCCRFQAGVVTTRSGRGGGREVADDAGDMRRQPEPTGPDAAFDGEHDGTRQPGRRRRSTPPWARCPAARRSGEHSGKAGGLRAGDSARSRARNRIGSPAGCVQALAGRREPPVAAKPNACRSFLPTTRHSHSTLSGQRVSAARPVDPRCAPCRGGASEWLRAPCLSAVTVNTAKQAG